VTKFCMWVDIQDVITFATFDDDRLRGLGMTRGRISRFPIDLGRRPYNSLAQPCKCMMCIRSDTTHNTTTWRTDGRTDRNTVSISRYSC